MVAALAEAMASFSLHDKDGDGRLNFREFDSFVKAANEEHGYLDENNLSVYIKQALRKADSDGDGRLSLADFKKWHAAFAAELVRFGEEQEAKRLEKAKAMPAAAAAAASAEMAPAPQFSGNVWECKLSALQQALDCAYAGHRTPLIIDATGSEDGGATPLETFYTYSGHQLVELKKMVVDVNVTKTQSLDEALDDVRAKLVLALKRGYSLILLMANSAPPLRSQFCRKDKLPFELFDQTQVQAVRSADGELKGSFLSEALTHEDQVIVVHPDFNVVAVTRFDKDDYAEFLAEELPLDLMQPILVTLEK
jgi:hypothetical protein